jgi:TonB family protein
MISRATLSFCKLRRRRRGFSRLSVGFLIIISASRAASAGNQPPWNELRSPNFIVVTNASEAQARRTAYQFEMIRAVFRTYFGQKQESVEQPVIIIATKDENTLKGLLPEYWVQKGTAHPSGMYLGGTDANYIALRLDVGLNQEAYEPFEPVYHEYVHYLTRQLIAYVPLWVVEGLAEFYGNTRIRNKDVYVGAPSTSNLIILHQQQVLPVSTLFEIDATSPYYHEQDKTSIFYAQSWALTHYLVARDWKEHTHRMSEFIHLLATGVGATEAASQTIGNAKALDEPLRRYIHSFSFTAAKVDPPKIEESGFRVREITDARALAVEADFMAHRGRYAEARRMLEEALKTDPKLDVAYDGLSFVALQQGDAAEAGKWSSQALVLDPQDYRANYYYAWSLIKAGHIEEQSLGKAEASLRAVTTGNPEFVPAYDAMAYVLELEGGKEKLDEAYSMTQQAVSREPGNVYYRVRAAEVLERQQRPQDAVRVATLAMSMAKTAEERQAASAALAGAQQFKETGEKIQAMQASQAAGGKLGSEAVAPTTAARGVTNQVKVATRVVLLSNPQGVNFHSYLSGNVIPKIQREWSVQIQKVNMTAAAKTGTVIIEFAIERDGSIAEMKLQQSTQEQVLDDAVRGAILAASPFAALPAQFQGKDIAVRFQCDYNPVPTSDQSTDAGDSEKPTQN